VLDTLLAIDEAIAFGRTVEISSTVDAIPLVAEDWDPFAATLDTFRRAPTCDFSTDRSLGPNLKRSTRSDRGHWYEPGDHQANDQLIPAYAPKPIMTRWPPSRIRTGMYSRLFTLGESSMQWCCLLPG
jgi:hypothetical protein